MRVFVTGATGFVGSAVVAELLNAGHQVLGLARNEANAEKLKQAGAEVHHGDLTDPESLAAGASACDGVIHTAFIHDFSNIAESGKTDKIATDVMGAALEGSNKPFITTTGLGFRSTGRVGTEDDAPDPASPVPHRIASEIATLALASRGIRAMLLRLPPSTHGRGDHGFVPMLINIAREKGSSAYVGDGSARWPAAHRLDAARLYRLALENGTAGSTYLAIADEGVATREIAEVIGRRLNLPVVQKSPEEALEHFGWMGRFFGPYDLTASSALTQERLGWKPTQPGLIADLDQPYYFEK